MDDGSRVRVRSSSSSSTGVRSRDRISWGEEDHVRTLLEARKLLSQGLSPEEEQLRDVSLQEREELQGFSKWIHDTKASNSRNKRSKYRTTTEFSESKLGGNSSGGSVTCKTVYERERERCRGVVDTKLKNRTRFGDRHTTHWWGKYWSLFLIEYLCLGGNMARLVLKIETKERCVAMRLDYVLTIRLSSLFTSYNLWISVSEAWNDNLQLLTSSQLLTRCWDDYWSNLCTKVYVELELSTIGLRTPNLCGHFVVTLLDGMPMLEWYMARLVGKNGHQRQMCYIEMGLFAHNRTSYLLWIWRNSNSVTWNNILCASSSQLLTRWWDDCRSNWMPKIVCGVGSVNNRTTYLKVCGTYVVTLLDWMRVGLVMARLVGRNGHQRETCCDKIALCA